MAIPRLLIGSVFSGGNVQVGELVGGTTFNQIGADITATAGTLSADAQAGVCNRVIEYRGQIYVWYFDAANTHTIDVYNRGTGLWTNQVAANNGSFGFHSSGFYIANTGSLQRLFIVTRAGTSTTTLRYTDDGTTWNGVTSLGDAEVGFSLDQHVWVMFNNKLYGAAFVGTSSEWVEYDPIALSINFAIAPWRGSTVNQNGTPIDFCVYDDRLFAIALDAVTSSSANWALWEFTGGGWALNTTITTGGGAGGNGGVDNDSASLGQVCLFKQPGQDKLIAIVPYATTFNAGNGLEMYELTQNGAVFTPNDVTDVCIPANLRPGARGTSADAAQDRVYAYVSNDTDPTVEEVFLFIAQGPAPGSSYSVYTFTDTSTLLSSPAAGPSTTFSIPSQKVGGGDRINRNVANQCIIESAGEVLGGYRISYRVYGTQSGQSVTLYYSVDQETPTTGPASISAQTGGSGISGGNTVTGITGDDGVTLFTLDWDLEADGIADGESVHIILDIR